MFEPQTFLNYIGGEWKSASSKLVEASMNPANRHETVGYIQKSTLDDLEEAVGAAKEAKMGWRKLSGLARGEFLFKAANQIEQRLDEIAEMMTREMGKTLPEAKGETARGVAILRYYAGEGMRSIGDVIPSSDSAALMFTSRAPLGVVGVITPWNFPVAIPIWKMAPALIYGNTVVFKPAQETAVTAALFMECFHAAGLPAGVINMVTGDGGLIGQAMADHPDIQGITFTGSNVVGKRVGQSALARGAKYQLEMGGKNPVIVARDADLDLAVDATISGGLKSTGQKCTATSRVIVHSEIYEAFKMKLLEKVQNIRLGSGLEAATWMGPLASENQFRTVLSYITKGVEEGGTLLCGGGKGLGRDLEAGYFVEPTIFENISSSMTIAQEEIFGPVLALIKVDSLEEAIQIANDVKFGLSASIFTRDISTMLTFMQDIDAGMVRINAESAGVELQAPFGGVKQSSSGSREQGQAAIEFYTDIKTIFVKA
ncbi:alpha-ketoglutaric semialdehyde dehydrogenase GucD [Paenibacillus anseongense]|uniref:alpha-ketoglutaric semialdehyde dehydrogenase GucD n=1 Tax=Paenibacillus anseongense TaxID=2682845 RepID=UPI002DB7A443|nr:alpha-ketoglutaric semialdehyde dehydrogenase GucD [Paenibacillus anseongense]MEC0264580.1 aldehyde dehydrogenase family protein [Paenibacillus anseongense]